MHKLCARDLSSASYWNLACPHELSTLSAISLQFSCIYASYSPCKLSVLYTCTYIHYIQTLGDLNAKIRCLTDDIYLQLALYTDALWDRQDYIYYLLAFHLGSNMRVHIHAPCIVWVFSERSMDCMQGMPTLCPSKSASIKIEINYRIKWTMNSNACKPWQLCK